MRECGGCLRPRLIHRQHDCSWRQGSACCMIECQLSSCMVGLTSSRPWIEMCNFRRGLGSGLGSHADHVAAQDTLHITLHVGCTWLLQETGTVALTKRSILNR